MSEQLKKETYENYFVFYLFIPGEKEYYAGRFYRREKILEVPVGRPYFKYKHYGDCFSVQQQVLDELPYINKVIVVWKEVKYEISYGVFIGNIHPYKHDIWGDQVMVPMRLFHKI